MAYQADPDAAVRCRRNCLFTAAVIVISAAFLALIAMTILTLPPHAPYFTADSFSVSNLTLSNNLLSADWGIRFTARNPNKKTPLYFERLHAEVYYDSESLAETNLAPFYHGPRNETRFTARFAARETFLRNQHVNRINEEKPEIKFKVWMVGEFRFKIENRWWFEGASNGKYLSVVCDDLKVNIAGNSSSDNLVGGPVQCRSGFCANLDRNQYFSEISSC